MKVSYCKRFSIIVLLLLASAAAARGVYQPPEEFVRDAFNGKAPATSQLWITEAVQAQVKKILGHEFDVLRLRYWGQGKRTAWVLEEIGKEKPITVGIVISAGKIETVKVLIFRESRGGEVRYPFFTDQFRQAALTNDRQLDRPIDGITGATLSVRALTKLSRLALYFHSLSDFK